MCLAVPMKIESIDGAMAVADSRGVKRSVSLALLPDARPGEHVLVHAGFAIQRIDTKEANEMNELLSEVGI